MRVFILPGLMIATLALAVSNGVGFAGPLEDGIAAYYLGDYATALKWYWLAAAQGNSTAQRILGGMYHEDIALRSSEPIPLGCSVIDGQDVPKDAQNNLGWMYAKGQGVRRTMFSRLCGSLLATPPRTYCNNPAALTTLRTGKGVSPEVANGKVYSHLALVDIKPRDLMPSAMVDHQRGGLPYSSAGPRMAHASHPSSKRPRNGRAPALSAGKRTIAVRVCLRVGRRVVSRR